MAIITIKHDDKRNKKWLAVAPDWIKGANKDDSFVATNGTTGTMDYWYYDSPDIEDLISHLSKKIIDKYESEKFKYILFQIYSAINGSGNIHDIYYKDVKHLTFIINNFKTDNILTRKFNYFFPPTETYKNKKRILYLLIALQHISCDESGEINLKIPTVCNH